MELFSAALKHEEEIPKRYVRKEIGGENVSLPLNWEGAPDGTKSFALSIVDPHPVANNWIHWLVINIPPAVNAIEEGASGRSMPSGSVELQNSFGASGYGGPQPPKGSGVHPYVVAIHALDVEKLDLDKRVSLDDFKEAIEGKTLEVASITGYYSQ